MSCFRGSGLIPATGRPDYNAIPSRFAMARPAIWRWRFWGCRSSRFDDHESFVRSRMDVTPWRFNAGDLLTIETATPADGTGEFVNTFDPVIELVDPTGTMVAGDDDSASDGRNARLTHTATMPGVYTIRVGSAAGSAGGTYVLSVSGATGSDTIVGDLDENGTVGLSDLDVLQKSLGSSSANADLCATVRSIVRT